MATAPKEPAEGKVTVMIDPKRTRGGVRINGKNYVGKVTVPESLGEELMRIQEEHAATVDKLTDPSVRLRNQNIDVTRKAFMADPALYGNHPHFTKQYGMSDAFQISFISDKDLEEWKEERMGLYGY